MLEIAEGTRERTRVLFIEVANLQEGVDALAAFEATWRESCGPMVTLAQFNHA